MLTLRIAAAVLVLVVSANGLADASVASSSEGEALGRPEAKMLYLRLSSPGGQHRDLFSMNLDGSRKRRLTWDYAAETSVVWLPDGRRIGYARFDGNNNIVVMNADGSGKRNLTTRGATSPTWSPDGTKIAFHRSAGPTGKFSIRVADADGGNERDLKRCCWPAWSPDGR